MMTNRNTPAEVPTPQWIRATFSVEEAKLVVSALSAYAHHAEYRELHDRLSAEICQRDVTPSSPTRRRSTDPRRSV